MLKLEKGLSLDVKLLQVALETQIADRVRAAERTEAQTVLLIVVYSLIALAVGVGAALLSQRLLAPIQTLTEGVKAVAAGDLTRKVEVRSDDEIGLLAREFNAMAASLDRQRDELRRAERLAAVGRISAQITHEIRNPLNAIGLNAELLAEELEASPGARRARPCSSSRAISREVDRLNGVAEEYLRFARLPRPAARPPGPRARSSGSLLDFLGARARRPPASRCARDLGARPARRAGRRGAAARGLPEPAAQQPRGDARRAARSPSGRPARRAARRRRGRATPAGASPQVT